MGSKSRTKPKTVVFLHPDLGIGGAERLVVDAAVGLQKRGHRVVILTSHCDPKHCFDEARDGTLDVRVRGDSLFPPSLLDRFTILCAIARQLHLIFQVWLLSNELADLAPDAFFVDQLSAGMPLLSLAAPKAPIFFYCHHPDLLLVQGRTRWWKRAYRIPFDLCERWSMQFAKVIAVNSDYTKSVVARTWPSLARDRDLRTVYPCVDTAENAVPKETKDAVSSDDPLWAGKKFFLSINRFERKKDIALALRAFAALPEEKRRGVRLVLAGGYDPRVLENVDYHRELEELATRLLGSGSHRTARTIVTALEIPDEVQVLFLLSVPGALKTALLRHATLLLYTPEHEHFGIVPLEAMLAGCPVLATASGGPLETVQDGKTGWLRPAGDAESWSQLLGEVLSLAASDSKSPDQGRLATMGRAGAARVRELFGQDKMAERLDDIVDEMVRSPRSNGSGLWAPVIVLILSVAVACISAVILSVWRLERHGLGIL